VSEMSLRASKSPVPIPLADRGDTKAHAYASLTRDGRAPQQFPGEPYAGRAVQRTGLESELKLEVSARHLDMLRRHPFFRNRKSSGKHELISIYFDTKDSVLRRHGLSFRLRRKGDQLYRTIKGTYRGMLDRAELETLFIHDGEGHTGSVDAFLQHLDRNLPTALKPIFKTKIVREVYRIGGVEVCLDKGEIIAGRRSAPVVEIELELRGADRSELFALARQVSAIVPAEISVKSKSDRGYDLVAGVKDRAIMAQHPVLPRSCSAADAFQIVCSECLHHLISNRSGVRAHIAEALHQARVALRRFDAAIKLFGKIQSDQKAMKVARELKWIGDELSGARELDVFITDLLVPFRTTHPKESGVAEVYRACIQQREKAYERANAALASQRFRIFLIDAAEWIEVDNGQQIMGSRLKREQSAKDLVSRALSKIWSKMRPGRRIDELDLHGLHKLRLRAKRMRYTIEFTRGLYDNKSHPKRIERVRNELAKLQSTLGTLNDIASAKTILHRITHGTEAVHKNGKLRITSTLKAMVAANQETQKAKQLKKAAKALKKLENVKPFWA
jgi:triphosphatase